ncbi:hypothetical protein [Bradyrhizobium cenepequi]
MDQANDLTITVREGGALASLVGKGRHYQRMIQQAKGLPPLVTAVVCPVDDLSLTGAIEAAEAQLIVPVLVGPEAKIRAVAERIKLDLSSYKLVPAEHSHAAAATAAALARGRMVEALMKGSLHTDEFMAAIGGVLRMGNENATVFGSKFQFASLEWLKSFAELPRNYVTASKQALGFAASCLEDQADYLKKLGECTNPAGALKCQLDFAQQCWSRSSEASKFLETLRTDLPSAP